MVAILDYGIGNINSILNMFKKIGVKAAASSDPSVIANADKLILPGVGHFDYCMQQLRNSNFYELLHQKVLEDKIPLLGVCVGCQMLMEASEEGREKGLGWIRGSVVRFKADQMNANLKIPHMDWTEVYPKDSCLLYSGIADPRFYFVHSYHVQCDDPGWLRPPRIMATISPLLFNREIFQVCNFTPKKAIALEWTFIAIFRSCIESFMKRIRVIPVLLIHKSGLVKSEKFKNYRYVGDPVNAVRIFNDKEVDELAILDIDASRTKTKPNLRQIAEIASEAFMPLSYGGGITQIDEVKEILFSGIEKVILNKMALTQPEFISRIAERFGTQSVAVSMDVKKNWLGKYRLYSDNGSKIVREDPEELAARFEKMGAGEILLNSIDRDGTYEGYDIEILQRVSNAVTIPVIACGGASGIDDFRMAVTDGHASAVAAGSMFVFQRPHHAVLISYPSPVELKEKLYSRL